MCHTRRSGPWLRDDSQLSEPLAHWLKSSRFCTYVQTKWDLNVTADDFYQHLKIIKKEITIKNNKQIKSRCKRQPFGFFSDDEQENCDLLPDTWWPRRRPRGDVEVGMCKCANTHAHSLVLLHGYSVLSAVLNLMQPAFRYNTPLGCPFYNSIIQNTVGFHLLTIAPPDLLSLPLFSGQQGCTAECGGNCSSSRPVRKRGMNKNRTSSPYAWSANEAGMGGGCPERGVYVAVCERQRWWQSQSKKHN